MEVHQPAPPKLDEMDALILVRLPCQRSDLSDPSNGYLRVPGPSLHQDVMDLEAKLREQAEQPLEPSLYGLPAVPLPT